MLYPALRPSPTRPRDDQRTAFLREPPRRSASSLFEVALGWERRLDTLALRATRRLVEGSPSHLEVLRRVEVANRALLAVLTARLTVGVRHAMLEVMMPQLDRDLLLALRGDRGVWQPSWRRLREREHALRQRFEHAVAALEQRQVPDWRQRQFVGAGTLILEGVVLPEPRLAVVQLSLVEAGLGVALVEAGLDGAFGP